MAADWMKLGPKRRTREKYDQWFADVAQNNVFGELMDMMRDVSTTLVVWSNATRAHRIHVAQRFADMHKYKYQEFQGREFSSTLILGECRVSRPIHR